MTKLKGLTAATLIAFSISFSSTASADFVGIYAGTQNWNYDFDGSISSLGNDIDLKNDLNLEGDNANVYYVAIEHPVPFLPNVRIQQNTLEGNGVGIASQNFVFQSGSYNVGDAIATSYDFSHTDYTLYYEILDNWVNLDLGFSAKQFDGFADVRPDGQAIIAVNTRVEISGTVPMLYAKAQFDLPFTGLSTGGAIQLGQFQDDSLTDANVYIAYEGDTGFGAEVGYRIFELEFDDFDELSSDLTLDGFYASLTFHF